MADQRDGGISWTDETWNPIRGCSRISLGCGGPHGQGGCYAERLAIRLSKPGQPYHGLVKSTPAGPRWTGEVRFVENVLDQPLRWKKPRRIFVNSMSDLFHEKVEDEWIDRIFAVMALAGHHVFQVLTKRPERMWAYCTALGKSFARLKAACPVGWTLEFQGLPLVKWPLPNVHLGVSVEDQATADDRIPLLLQTPATVRWVSYEPALGPVDFEHIGVRGSTRSALGCRPCAWTQEVTTTQSGPHTCGEPHLDWIVVGGESGPGARPFDLDWASSTIDDCTAAEVPVFVKQLGSRPFAVDRFHKPFAVHLRDRKGGDMQEWPEDLRVREFPA